MYIQNNQISYNEKLNLYMFIVYNYSFNFLQLKSIIVIDDKYIFLNIIEKYLQAIFEFYSVYANILIHL